MISEYSEFLSISYLVELHATPHSKAQLLEVFVENSPCQIFISVSFSLDFVLEISYT